MIGTIAPPGQGWREAPGWWFKHGVDRHLLQITDLLLEIDPPPRLRLRRSHPSFPGTLVPAIDSYFR